jgi:RNA polymerase sigma-70 factor (ECF subfamily)
VRRLSDDTDRGSAAVVEALVDNHRRFLAFLERRVGSRAVAEDLLQDAFVRGLERAPTLRRSEAATAWFYRVLRNALVDHFRKQRTEARVMAAAAAEVPEWVDQDEELRRTVCGCIAGLVDTLKPEYASALRRVEFEGLAVRTMPRAGSRPTMPRHACTGARSSGGGGGAVGRARSTAARIACAEAPRRTRIPVSEGP